METPLQSLTRLKKGPRPVIGCLPLYPPLELLHGLGLAPVVLWGLAAATPHVNDADRHVQNYACSVARRLAQFAINEGRDLLDGLFFYNAGDTLRNLPEILREGIVASGGQAPPMFHFHVPMTSPAQADASGYLKNEVTSLVRSLEQHYGLKFSRDRFAESIALYGRRRELCLRMETAVADGRLMFADFCRILTAANFLEVNEQIVLLETTIAGLEGRPISGEKAARVVVSGIMPPPAGICELMDQAGLRVAGNDIAFLYRSYACMPENGQGASEYYVRFYREHFPCTTLLYSADRRPEAIMKLVSRKKARGFVFIGEKFCEYEYFELPYLEKQLKDQKIPVLSLEISMDDGVGAETFRTRLEAFRELMDS